MTYPTVPRYAGRQLAPAAMTASQSGELRSQFAYPTAHTALVQPLALLQLNSVFAMAQDQSPQSAQSVSVPSFVSHPRDRRCSRQRSDRSNRERRSGPRCRRFRRYRKHRRHRCRPRRRFRRHRRHRCRPRRRFRLRPPPATRRPAADASGRCGRPSGSATARTGRPAPASAGPGDAGSPAGAGTTVSWHQQDILRIARNAAQHGQQQERKSSDAGHDYFETFRIPVDD